MLIFLTDRLIFGKEDSFKAFQLKKKKTIHGFSLQFSFRGIIDLIYFLVKIWKYLKVSTVMRSQLSLIWEPSFPLLKNI